jgi:hypothetical protein
MDDTVLMGGDKRSIEKMLKTTMDFYDYNNIKLNIKKSDLLVINGENNQVKVAENSIVKTRNDNETIRYLGVYLDNCGKLTPTKTRIKEKVINFLRTIRPKRITYNQLNNIHNCILKSQLTYLMMLTILDESEIKQLDTLINKTYKNKMGLATNMGNDNLNNRLFTNFASIREIYEITKMNGAEIWANQKDEKLEKLMLMRIKDWKVKVWAYNATEKILKSNTKLMGDNWVMHVLATLAKNDLNVHTADGMPIGDEQSCLTSIYELIKEPDKLTRTSLKNNKIIAIEQITSANNIQLLP